MKPLAHLFVVAFLALLIGPWPSFANDQYIEVVKISAPDQLAVVRLNENQLQVLRPGDQVPGLGIVETISDTYILLSGDDAGKTLIRFKDGVQTVERIAGPAAEPAASDVQQSTSDRN